MQITVNIPDELAALARQEGVTPQAYVERLLTVEQKQRAATIAERKETLRRFLEAMPILSEDAPQYSGETFSREWIYQDHD